MSDYTPSGAPSTSSSGDSAVIRAEFSAIQTAVNSKADSAGSTSIVSVGTITTGTWDATDVAVTAGGTGRSTSTTAYGLLAAGTTATGVHQTLPAGATTDILVGGGASALPAWTTATGSGAPVRATSPTLVTPALGTPASGVVTNLTGTASININGTVGSSMPTTASVTTLVVNGDVTLIGAGKRILGNWDNALTGNYFQNRIANTSTYVSFVPNGTTRTAGLVVHNKSDGLGTGFSFDTNSISLNISSADFGGGHLPIVFSNSAERVRLDTSGNFMVTSSGLLGYGTGAGGTVTQATSKATTVTLNKASGQITMNNAALGAGAIVAFAVNCSLVEGIDNILVNQNSHSGVNYLVWARPVAAGGSFAVVLQNVSAGSLSDAVVINFTIFKGATS